MKNKALLFVPLVGKTSACRQKEGLKLIKDLPLLPRLSAVLPQSGKDTMKSPSFGTTCHFPHKGGRALGSTYYLTQGREIKRGFTLIELLVVVLIIGILAAVALPQYQKAVMRSRYATLKNTTEALYQAEQVYFLANGTYTYNFELLDIQPNGCTLNKDKNRCNYTWGFCELGIVNSRVHCENRKTLKNAYVHYWDGSNKGVRCWALTTDITDKYHKLCEAEGGTNRIGGTCSSGGCSIYTLAQ